MESTDRPVRRWGIVGISTLVFGWWAAIGFPSNRWAEFAKLFDLEVKGWTAFVAGIPVWVFLTLGAVTAAGYAVLSLRFRTDRGRRWIGAALGIGAWLIGFVLIATWMAPFMPQFLGL